MPRLTPTEAAASGFTDVLEISYQEMLSSAAGTLSADDTYTFSYQIPAYCVVERVFTYVTEAFAGAGTATVKVGDGSNDDGYIAAKTVSSAPAAGYNDGAYFNDGTTNNTVNGKVYATADTIDVLFTPQSTFNLNNLTAGKLTVKFKIARFL